MSQPNSLKRLFNALRKNRQRGLYSFVVVCFLAATVLPASVFAQPSPLAMLAANGPCSVDVLAAETLTPASRDQTVTIPKAVVDQAIFIANWSHSYTDAEAVEALLRSLFLMAGASTADIIQLTTSIRQRIPLEELNDRVRHPLDEIVYNYLDAALLLPAVQPFAPYVWNVVNGDVRVDDLPVDTALLIAQSATRYDLGVRMLRNAQEYVSAAHACALQDAAFASRFDALNAQKLGASILDGATTIIQKTSVPIPTPLMNSIQGNGTAQISLNQLTEIGNKQLDDVNNKLIELRTLVREIDDSQKVITEYFKNQLEKELKQKLAKEKSEEVEKTFKTAEAGIKSITTLIKLLDPKLAKDFNTVTSSYLEVVKSVNEWLKATSGLGSLDSIFSFSTVIMTGNIVGAVVNIMGMFSPGKPSPEQQILEQIAKLRQQVNQLRTEMHKRFDRIDAALNQIFTTMQQRFDQIDVTLGKINGNIRDVQRSLIDLDMRLSQFERNNFELLNVLGRRPLLDAINAGLDYKRVTGTDMPFQPEFVNFERTFHTWGTVHAFDPLNTGPSQRDYSDGALFRELTTFPLDANLNYLNGWLMAHGRPGLASGMLPSPRDWLLASRAYTQLGQENPAHMARIDPTELAELEAVGVQIEEAIGNITAPAATAVTAAAADDDSTFDFVTGLYDEKLAKLNTALLGLENEFLAEVRATLADENVPFDLFGGAEQTLVTTQGSSAPWIPPSYTKAFIQDPEKFQPTELPATTGMQLNVAAEKPMMLAELLRLSGTPQGRIELKVSTANVFLFPCNPPPPNQCSQSADVTIVAEIYSGPVLIRKLSFTTQRVWPRVQNIEQHVINTWTKEANGLQTLFDAGFVVVPLSQGEQTIANNRLANFKSTTEFRLQQLQQGLYARFVDRMGTGSLHDLLVEIAGYKKLIDAFTTLGLPRAIASDEFLHAMLFGEQRLFDDVLIVADFAISATQPITGPSLFVNERTVFKQKAADRLALYLEIVNGYLDAIAAGESPVAAGGEQAVHVEAADYLVSARHALDLTVRIARITPAGTPGNPTPTPTPPGNPGPTPTPLPPGSVQVFLPVVGK